MCDNEWHLLQACECKEGNFGTGCHCKYDELSVSLKWNTALVEADPTATSAVIMALEDGATYESLAGNADGKPPGHKVYTLRTISRNSQLDRFLHNMRKTPKLLRRLMV